MTMKKRRLKAKPSPNKVRKIKRTVKPKSSVHERLCLDLYNRLQSDYDEPIFGAMQEVADRLKLRIDVTEGTEQLTEAIMKRCNCQVETLQMNYPDHVSYRVCLSYTDKDKKPKDGHLYPAKTVVKTSHRLALAVTLAYVELCKQTGRFIT